MDLIIGFFRDWYEMTCRLFAREVRVKTYQFESVAVFLGSSRGWHEGTQNQNPVYEESAKDLGRLLAEKELRLVYGGGNAGLMGVLSESVLHHGGRILGVLSSAFIQHDEYLQQTHENATEVITRNIESRKWKMIRESEAFIVFPGGIGTFDELFEAAVEQYQRPYKGKMTISKPIIILNIDGYYDEMLKMIEKSIYYGFSKPVAQRLFWVADTPADAIRILEELRGKPRMELNEIGNVDGNIIFKAKTESA